MSELAFECIDARPERYAAAPTMAFSFGVSETTGDAVHAIALRCQMRIQPQLRGYSGEEGERLADLFGDRSRWGETLKPLQFTNLSLMVPGFQGTTELDVPVPCTYDFDVAATKYFHSLDEGEVPLLLLFSGTVFVKGDGGFRIDQVPWDREATYRLPAAVWREMMDLYFPNSGWIRMRRETLDALQRFKSRQALPTWDDALEILLKQSGEGRP